jgi:AcrR family transcriptional regulator
VRELTMRQAAQATCPSVGGLYHYFPSKRDLVLHGLNPAALERRCADFWARSRHLEAGQPAQFLEALVEAFVDKVAFVRPSVQAALELGADSLWAGFEPCIDVGIARLAEALARVAPLAARQDPQLFRRAVRRVFFAALVDPSTPAGGGTGRALRAGHRPAAGAPATARPVPRPGDGDRLTERCRHRADPRIGN